MADSAIPMSFRPPAIEYNSPLDSMQRQLTLKNLAQSVQLNAARVKDEEMKAKNAEEDRQDEQAIHQAFIDNNGDHDKARAALGGKIKLRNLQRWDADNLTQLHNAAALSTQQRQAYQANADALAQESAKLLQTPPEQRAAATQQSLETLKKFGVDTSGFQFDPTTGPSDQQLQAILAGSKYNGQVMTIAQKKAQEQERLAQAERARKQTEIADEKESEAQKQRMRETAARTHLSVTTPEQHAEWLKTLPPEIASEYAAMKTYTPQGRKVIQSMALSSKDRIVDEDRDLTRQAREQAQLDRDRQMREGLDIRQQLANQSGAFQAAMIGLKTGGAGGPKLTPGQLQVEERNINSVENGTANRPGLNAQRVKLGQQLKSGVNAKGESFRDKDGTLTKPEEHDRIQSELQAVNDNLQQTQFRKAKLYNIANPDPADIEAAKDGSEIEAMDGSVWKKQNGVAFFSRMAGAPAPAGKAPAPATPKTTGMVPSAGPAASGRITEADARAKAKAAGKDADWYVNELRKQKLLQ